VARLAAGCGLVWDRGEASFHGRRPYLFRARVEDAAGMSGENVEPGMGMPGFAALERVEN
jgi:hypothetical protein